MPFRSPGEPCSPATFHSLQSHGLPFKVIASYGVDSGERSDRNLAGVLCTRYQAVNPHADRSGLGFGDEDGRFKFLDGPDKLLARAKVLDRGIRANDGKSKRRQELALNRAESVSPFRQG
jgi:hypothetical protein